MFRPAATLLVAVVFLGAPADVTAEGGPHDATTHRSFDDVEHWVSVFDAPERVECLKPDAVVAALALVVGAMLIAMFEVIFSAFISYPVATAILYGTLLAILFFRPQGLFGETIQKRA